MMDFMCTMITVMGSGVNPVKDRFSYLGRSLGIVLLIFMSVFFFPSRGMGQSPYKFRLGFSSSLFGEVNRNDVTAAIRIWGETFFTGGKIPMIIEPVILGGISELRTALSDNALDFMSLPLDLYVGVRQFVDNDMFQLSVVSGSITEEYLLLVSSDRGIHDLAGLRGRNLRLLTSSRAALAPLWLEALLARKGMTPVTVFFKNVETDKKAVTAILPVFFGKADACVVTRKVLDTMIELNPQVGKKLTVIAASPPIIPVVGCFALNVDKNIREQVQKEIGNWNSKPAGKQCMTMFQLDGLEAHPVSILDDSLALLAEYKQTLKKKSKSYKKELMSTIADVIIEIGEGESGRQVVSE